MELLQKMIERDSSVLDLGEFRRMLVQMDREGSRKKSIRGLNRLIESASPRVKPYISSGLAMAYFLDQDFTRSLSCLRDVISMAPLTPLALFAATMKVLIYHTLGMKRERFEAEGSRLLMMKKIAMHSDDPFHRVLALSELKKELEARELHDEAHQCDVELIYWEKFLRRKKSPEMNSRSLS